MFFEADNSKSLGKLRFSVTWQNLFEDNFATLACWKAKSVGGTEITKPPEEDTSLVEWSLIFFYSFDFDSLMLGSFFKIYE